MKRTCILLDPKQLEALRKLSEKTGAPMAELIRRAIAAYLEKKQSALAYVRTLERKAANG